MKMKNKKLEQSAAKDKHKNQLKSKRRNQPDLIRSAGNLSMKPTILIVCEGKNTEPSYFKQFRLSSATIKSIGVSQSTKSLVKRAVELSEGEEYDQVWCVFDKDDFLDRDFNEAVEMATRKKIKVAYSNQSFEYWLILHFDDHQGGSMHRTGYTSKINALLQPFGIVYDGNGCKRINSDFFEILDGVDEKSGKKRIQLAISRAKRNWKRLDHLTHARRESSTTVYKLIEVLLKYI